MIRSFTDDDYNTVEVLHQRCFDNPEIGPLPDHFFISDDGMACGGVVGIGKVGLICNLAVDPDQQRRGLGRLLLTHLCAVGRLHYSRLLVASRAHNLAYYEGNGFTPIARYGLPRALKRCADDIYFLELMPTQ